MNLRLLYSGLWFSVCELPVQPGRNFFSRARPVLAQPFAAEMHAFSCLVPQVSNECIGVGPFQSNAGGPERPLRCADVGGASIFGSVVAGLCDKPWSLPTGLSARIAD